MEGPPWRARAHVERADVTGRHVGTHGPALDRRADDDDVAHDERR
jgi:hypothetical protein